MYAYTYVVKFMKSSSCTQVNTLPLVAIHNNNNFKKKAMQ